ncbi:MAG: hypothetical protein Q9195_003041 [Heterodermia aff. obscurata]
MESPIQTCVVDATTLIDHIHGIKKLIHDGQLRVTVPLSTVESVEKIYQKSIEPKPEPKEPARPKASGRPAKVHPAFDINPRVVREFLDRCRVEENKLGVEFQQETEQYTPWKNLQEQEEEQKAPDAKPAGYAAALLKKLNIKEAPVQVAKGPVKPKLVARTPNGPNSPWKRSVPAISIHGVPRNLRDIFGYTLWRLHERETFSFQKDASIMLTSDQELSAVAERIGINVQSFDEFTSSLNAPDTNLASWGDVECEFGVRPPSKAASRKDHEKSDNNTVVESDLKDTDPVHTPKLQESGELVAMSIDSCKARKDESTSLDKHQEETIEAQDLHSENAAPGQGQANGELQEQPKAMEDIEIGEEGKLLIQPAQLTQVEVPPAKPRAWADVVSNRMRPIEERYPSPAPGIPELSESTKLDPEPPIDPLAEQVNQEKASNIADWVRMVSQASMETETPPIPKGSHRKRSPRNKKEKASPQEQPAKPFRPILMQRTAPKSSQAASDQAHTVSDKARTPSPPLLTHIAEQVQPTVEATSTDKIVEVEPVSLHRSTNSSASSGKTVPSKDTSLPKSAPVDEPEDSEEEVVVFNPRAKRLSAQQQAPQLPAEEKPAHSKQASNGKIVHTKHLSLEEPDKIQQLISGKAVPVKQHRPPKPRAAPVVIDPDAFGRDFASNPQTNQQNGFRSHPRPNSQHGPPRQVSQHGSPRGGARSGRPFIHPQALTALQNGQHGHANPGGRGGHQNRMPPAITNGQNNYVTTKQNSVAVNGQAALRPSPRPSPRVSPQHLPQAIATEPDVDFVLQSGPPRGSSRGRGKLWTP